MVQVGDASPVSVTDRVYTATGLEPGAELPISVVAENDMGQSPTTSITGRTLVSPVPNPRPSVPQLLRATAPTDTSVIVDWQTPTFSGRSQIVGYLVSWNGTQRSTTDTSLLVTGLRPSTDYAISVVAINGSGWSDPVVIRVRTLAAPVPGPGPSPNNNPPISPFIPGSNSDGSFGADQDARSIQQVLPGRWPASRLVVSSKELFLEKSARMKTNAGQTARGSVTYKSPSVKSARIIFDRNKRAYVLRVTLKPKRMSGSVIVTVNAPIATVDGVTFEPLHASKRFLVRPNKSA
jgi:hypothetical protein